MGVSLTLWSGHRTRKDNPMKPQTEKQFQAKIIEVAKLFGWHYYHPYDSRRSPPGFPDLVLVKDRVLFRELKTEKGRLTAYQIAWGKRLMDAGSDFAVWRPSMINEIYKELR